MRSVICHVGVAVLVMTFFSGARIGAAELSPAGNWLRSAPGDIDADGMSDVIFQAFPWGWTLLWNMDGRSVVSGHGIWTFGPWVIAGVGDFNADRKADIVWIDQTTGLIDIWLLDRERRLSNRPYSPFPAGWALALIADMDADGRSDIFWRHGTTGATLIWFMDGTTVMRGAYLPSSSPDWKLAGAGDFDGDAQTDVVWTRFDVTANVWFMNGTALRSNVTIRNPEGLKFVGAIDGLFSPPSDGRVEMVWAGQDSTDLTALFVCNVSLSASQFCRVMHFFGMDGSWTFEAMGDLDGDAMVDGVWRNPAGIVQVCALGWTNDTRSCVNYPGYPPSEWRIVSPR